MSFRLLMPRRLALVVLVAAMASIPAVAAARQMTPTSGKLTAGRTAVTACGTLSGVVPDFTISSGTVTAVSLTNIPSTCNGGVVSLTVTNGSTSLGAGGPVTVASGAATVPISPAAPNANVTHVRIVIIGP